ncbi:WD40 repeat domain-containing protein [bacterium]|nr:MAG: WD40 repeat domain-containing protein [bacterium]
MKRIIFTATLIVSFFSAHTNAANLDGTSTLVYQSTRYTPNKNDSVTGFVRINAGFTAPVGGAVIMDTITSVSGLIYGTEQNSTVTLNGNLKLSSQSSLSGVFDISGHGNVIFFDGNLTLPANKIMSFRTDTIIDGCGNTLTFTNYSQFLIDNSVTLTLRNMKIKTTHASLARPCIRCQSNTSRLALDNVTFALAENFDFRNGRLYFHNSVRFTGTSQFIYRSTQASYISSGALLTFDPNTTLYYYPSSTAQDLIRLVDQTSKLYLNNATLQTTHTGMLLSKGSLFLDNLVSFSTRANTKLLGITLNTSPASAAGFEQFHWRHDNQYMAAATGATAPQLRVYRWNGTTLTSIATVTATRFNTAQWSPSGRFLAVGGFSITSAQPQVQIFRFNGTTLTRVATFNYTAFSSSTRGVNSVAWHPSEQFLAAGGFPVSGSGDAVQVLKFNQGTSLTLVASDTFGGTPNTPGVQEVAWTSDGNYLLVVGTAGGASTTGIIMYSFDGSSLTTKDSVVLNNVLTGAIRPDDQFIAIGLSNASTVRAYSWNGSTLGTAITYAYGTTVNTLRWSSDGQYMAVGGTGPTNSNELQILSFNGATISLVASVNQGTTIPTVAWTLDDRYLASYAASVNYIYNTIYQFDYRPQAITNGLIFGNPSEGSESNLSTYLLSDARVEVAGALTLAS